MQNPERFTIVVEPHQQPEVVFRRVKALLKELELDETQYRVYMDGNIKTVINVIIDELFSEQFILEALNRQVRFVATNEKIRRIMALVSNEFDEEVLRDIDFANKTNGSEKIHEIEEDINEIVPVDETTVKFAEMLHSEEPDKVVDEAEEMIQKGEEIINRAKTVLITTVENEIKRAVKNTMNNPRNINKSMQVLKDLMSNKTLNDGEFRDLSQKAGFNAIKLVERHNKYSDELIEIMKNSNVDDYVRIRSAIAFVENMKRQHYSFSEIQSKLDNQLLKEIYNRTKNLLKPEEINIIQPLIAG